MESSPCGRDFCSRKGSGETGSNRFANFRIHCERFTRLHTIKDQLEVGPVSGRGTFNPLSFALHKGIRFFQPPMPALSTVSLTGYLPVSLLFV